VVIAPTPADLAFLDASRWLPLAPQPGVRAWTDDYSNILGALAWRPNASD